jgi:hypothetical protein
MTRRRFWVKRLRFYKRHPATRSSLNTHKLHRYAITCEGGTPLQLSIHQVMSQSTCHSHQSPTRVIGYNFSTATPRRFATHFPQWCPSLRAS